MAPSQKVSTCLWFDCEAEAAARFYTSLFANSRLTGVTHYGPGAPMPEGTPLVVSFVLDGTEFSVLNGGPHFKHSEAASLVVRCDTQDEVDRLWARLTEGGGAPGQCGWLKDRYGVSWQIVPAMLYDILAGSDRAAAGRVMAAVMTMTKLDIAKLEKAHKEK